MRTLLVTLLVSAAACTDTGGSAPPDGRTTDAAVIVDARPDARTIDAAPDAQIFPDAPPGAITTACTHACTAIGVCAMDTDATCVAECSADLADCTPPQVQQVDDCTMQACGDPNDPKNSPLILCLSQVACIAM